MPRMNADINHFFISMYELWMWAIHINFIKVSQSGPFSKGEVKPGHYKPWDVFDYCLGWLERNINKRTASIQGFFLSTKIVIRVH